MTTADIPTHQIPEAVSPPSGQARIARLWRGRAEDPRWVRPAFLGLLLLTFVAYLWDLSASGYANSFYSAAAQAGGVSWKALFFGSLDSANAITVDKPPAALWPMALSVRIFGLSSWAILVPQVLMGVGTVAVLYAAVRRRFSAAAGLIAGVVLATTPVAALMFRFNNPDALLALLMTVTIYFVLRALEDGRTKWLVWAGVAIGFAFLTKTLQAFLILPPLAVVYGVFAPTTVRRRLGQIGLSAGAMVVAGGWWTAIVELWPASSRPYIGGSQNNSFLELTFGYNGLGRISGDETGSVGGGGGGGGRGMGGGGWGETGLDRMFNSEIGSQISWLLPAALILLVAGIVITWRAKRTETARGAFLVWGSALLMTLLIFSFMAGIFHQYYTVALAPYLAALVGMGVTVLWEERGRFVWSAVLGVVVAATAVWAYVLLGRTPDYLPWLRWAVLVVGLVAAVGLAVAGRWNRRFALSAAGVGLVASLAAPFAYTVSTLNTGHTGSIVTAGPAGASRMGGMGGFPGRGGRDGGGWGGPRMGQTPTGKAGQTGQAGRTGMNGQTGANGQAPGNGSGGRTGQPPMGRLGNGQQGQGQSQTGQGRFGGAPGGWMAERGFGGRGGGGMGGLLDGQQVSAKVKTKISAHADDYTWMAAAIGSQNAASYQLATQKPVMAIGGFNGSDPSPTLTQFKKDVTDGKIHYFVAGGGMGGGMGRGGSGSGAASKITSWVEGRFVKVTVGSVTLYDLTQVKASAGTSGSSGTSGS
ncbi:glycosyltransferase family 39 protein [Streptomyces sp. NPDC090052]|uniref:glycosyltransferase family 39 protein n=1 Tax=Streptomyces sp. NPDC090052 TaxID=3365931 RepID=UPI003818B6BA